MRLMTHRSIPGMTRSSAARSTTFDLLRRIALPARTGDNPCSSNAFAWSRRVPPINVVVAATAADIEAETTAVEIAERADMTLVGNGVLQIAHVDTQLKAVAGPCAVVLVGPDDDTAEPAERYLVEYPDCVVVRVSAPRGDIVRIARHGLGLDELLAVVRALVDYAGPATRSRVVHLRPSRAAEDRARGWVARGARRDSTLLAAAIRWIHAILRNAVAGLASGGADLPGLTVTAATVVGQLDAGSVRTAADTVASVKQEEDALAREFAERNEDFEPLRIIARALALSDLELRLLLLALAPELTRATSAAWACCSMISGVA